MQFCRHFLSLTISPIVWNLYDFAECTTCSEIEMWLWRSTFRYVTGYFLHDFVDICQYASPRQEWELLLHHVIVSRRPDDVTAAHHDLISDASNPPPISFYSYPASPLPPVLSMFFPDLSYPRRMDLFVGWQCSMNLIKPRAYSIASQPSCFLDFDLSFKT